VTSDLPSFRYLQRKNLRLPVGQRSDRTSPPHLPGLRPAPAGVGTYLGPEGLRWLPGLL